MTDKLDKLRQLVAKDSEGLFVKLPELKEEWEAKKCCSEIGCTIAFALAKIEAALRSALAEQPLLPDDGLLPSPKRERKLTKLKPADSREVKP